MRFGRRRSSKLGLQGAQLAVDEEPQRLVETPLQRGDLRVEPAHHLDVPRDVERLHERLGVAAHDVAQGDVGAAHGPR